MRTLFWKLSSTALLMSGLAVLPGRAEETEVRGAVPTRGGESDSAVYRASDVMNLPVKNDDGSEVGRIKDLVINGESREVLYAVVAMSDGKEKDALYVMPWTVFQPSFGQGNTIQYTTLGLARSVWLEAPFYSQAQWRSAAYSQWGPRVSNYYSNHVTNIRNINNNNSVTTRKPVVPDKEGRNNEGKNDRDRKNDQDGKNDEKSDKDEDKSAREHDKSDKPAPKDNDEKPQVKPKNEPANNEKPAPKEPAPKAGDQSGANTPKLPAPKNPDPPGPNTPAPAPRDPKVPK